MYAQCVKFYSNKKLLKKFNTEFLFIFSFLNFNEHFLQKTTKTTTFYIDSHSKTLKFSMSLSVLFDWVFQTQVSGNFDHRPSSSDYECLLTDIAANQSGGLFSALLLFCGTIGRFRWFHYYLAANCLWSAWMSPIRGSFSWFFGLCSLHTVLLVLRHTDSFRSFWWMSMWTFLFTKLCVS